MGGNEGLWSWLVFGVGGTKAAMGQQWPLCEPKMAELAYFYVWAFYNSFSPIFFIYFTYYNTLIDRRLNI